MLRRVDRDVDALLGRVVWDEFPLLAGSELQNVLRRAARERTPVEHTEHDPGRGLWLHVRGVPTPDGGLAVFIQDVTVARSAELSRARSEERYRALVEASTVMVWTADPRRRGGRHAGLARPHRPAARRTCAGSAGSRPSTRTTADRFAPDGRRRSTPGGPSRPTSACCCAAARTHWFHARAVPIRAGERIVEWVGVFDDTHDAHVEAERRRAVENALGVLGSSLDYEWTLAAADAAAWSPRSPTTAAWTSSITEGNIRRVATTHVDPEKEEIVRRLWAKYPYRADRSRGRPRGRAYGPRRR